MSNENAPNISEEDPRKINRQERRMGVSPSFNPPLTMINWPVGIEHPINYKICPCSPCDKRCSSQNKLHQHLKKKHFFQVQFFCAICKENNWSHFQRSNYSEVLHHAKFLHKNCDDKFKNYKIVFKINDSGYQFLMEQAQQHSDFGIPRKSYAIQKAEQLSDRKDFKIILWPILYGERSIYCPINHNCNNKKPFKYQVDIEQHIKKHNPKIISQYYCYYCMLERNDWSNLDYQSVTMHVRRVHNDKPYQHYNVLYDTDNHHLFVDSMDQNKKRWRQQIIPQMETIDLH